MPHPSSKKLQDTIHPHNERGRIVALHRYQILHTPPESAFDEITKLAAQLLQAPIALIGLVDSHRIWFKSRYGLDLHEVKRTPGFCSTTILKAIPHVISDATLDSDIASHALVIGDGQFRSYAGVPLTTLDGYNIGTLCVVDPTPRNFSLRDIETLQSLAKLTMEHMETRLTSRHAASLGSQIADKHAKVQAAIQAGTVGIWEMDPKDGRFIWNTEMRKIYGLEEDSTAVTLDRWLSLLHPGDAPRVAREWNLALTRNSPFHSQYRILKPCGAIRHISSHAEIVRAIPTTISAVGVNLDLTDVYRTFTTTHRRQHGSIARRKLGSRALDN